jgi:glycosyltransferase involved in cell wall biosynthesis
MTPASPISVIVTCFNLDRYIGEAIQSVLDQRNAPEFEIIVVDDCSTDRSAEIIHGYPGAKYIRTKANGGVLLAMLAGVDQAQHDIICLLDGDDLWEPDKLALTGAAFDADPQVALATHDLHFIDGAGGQIDSRSRPNEELSPLSRISAGEKVREGILELADYVWLGSALSFRRSLARWSDFADFAMRLPDPGNCYQDWPLAYWVASLADVRMTYVDQKLFQYRLHGQNHSGDARTRERAIRNFTRGRNTYAAIARIAELRALPARLRRIADERTALSAAQVDLYSGRRLRAVSGFARSLSSARRNKILAKEALRFSIGAALGPRALTWLAVRPG